MPPTTMKSALAGALEDLSKGDFEKFCHQLLDRREEPRVKRSKVEDKSRLQITDVLVSHFTEEGALRVAAEILKQIGCSEEAQTLEKLAGGQSSKPGPSAEKHFVDKHRLDLVRRVSNISPILDELFDNEVVNQEVYDQIRALPTSQEKMRVLMSSMNAERSKDIFYKILSANERFLIEELHKKE